MFWLMSKHRKEQIWHCLKKEPLSGANWRKRHQGPGRAKAGKEEDKEGNLKMKGASQPFHIHYSRGGKGVA